MDDEAPRILLLRVREPEGIDFSNNSSSTKRMNSLLRIEQSYNYILNALKDVSEDDLICLSDNDEIPNFESTSFKNSKKISVCTASI